MAAQAPTPDEPIELSPSRRSSQIARSRSTGHRSSEDEIKRRTASVELYNVSLPAPEIVSPCKGKRNRSMAYAAAGVLLFAIVIGIVLAITLSSDTKKSSSSDDYAPIIAPQGMRVTASFHFDNNPGYITALHWGRVAEDVYGGVLVHLGNTGSSMALARATAVDGAISIYQVGDTSTIDQRSAWFTNGYMYVGEASTSTLGETRVVKVDMSKGDWAQAAPQSVRWPLRGIAASGTDTSLAVAGMDQRAGGVWYGRTVDDLFTAVDTFPTGHPAGPDGSRTGMHFFHLPFITEETAMNTSAVQCRDIPDRLIVLTSTGTGRDYRVVQLPEVLSPNAVGEAISPAYSAESNADVSFSANGLALMQLVNLSDTEPGYDVSVQVLRKLENGSNTWKQGKRMTVHTHNAFSFRAAISAKYMFVTEKAGQVSQYNAENGELVRHIETVHPYVTYLSVRPSKATDSVEELLTIGTTTWTPDKNPVEHSLHLVEYVFSV